MKNSQVRRKLRNCLNRHGSLSSFCAIFLLFAARPRKSLAIPHKPGRQTVHSYTNKGRFILRRTPENKINMHVNGVHE